jgi:hypothetical protein
MERMHMWSSFKILIEDLPAVIQRGRHCYKKQKIIVKKHILKSGKKPVATKLYENDPYMIHFQTYGC